MKFIKFLVPEALAMVKGSKGLADILKPALSRGEITVIGATTQDEYRNTILEECCPCSSFQRS